MAASSTVSPSTKGPLPNNDAVSGRDVSCRLLHHNQNQLHPSSSLKQLQLVPSQDDESREEFIAAGFEEDSIASSSSSFGLSVPPLVQEQLAVSEHLSSEDKSLVEGGEGSRCSDGSEECTTSSVWCKPHKGNDARWEAIRAIRSRDGDLGLGHFRLRKKLGCGDIGTVYLAELSGTKCCFAMKMMNKEALVIRKKQPRAQTEKDILERLDHPFLPTLYTHFETDQYSCLVMDYCPGGDLHALRQRWPGKCFSEQAARFYVAEILLALEYLHMLGIVYRDLKPENVLVREDGHIMLSDFDLSLCCTFSPTLIKWSNSDPDNPKSAHCANSACMIQPTCFVPRFFCRKVAQGAKTRGADSSLSKSIPEIMVEPTGARSMSFVGTHEYLAPEIIKGEGHGSAVDWWTLGIFLYELLFRKTPFKGSDNRATLFNVVGEPLRFPDTPAISFPARDLIRGLLVKEPQQRLAYRRGATELKHHPFFHSLNWALIRCDSPPEMPVLCKTACRH